MDDAARIRKLHRQQAATARFGTLALGENELIPVFQKKVLAQELQHRVRNILQLVGRMPVAQMEKRRTSRHTAVCDRLRGGFQPWRRYTISYWAPR